MTTSLTVVCLFPLQVELGPPNGHASSVTSLRQHQQLDDMRTIESCRRQTPSYIRSASSDHVKTLNNQLSSPLVRPDIFYTGSVNSLREYETCPDMATYVQVTPIASTVTQSRM